MAFAFLSKIRGGLRKTADAVGGGIRRALSVTRKLDRAAAMDLEEALITADLGAPLAVRLSERAQEAYRAREVKGPDEIVAFVREEVKAMLPSRECAPASAPDGPTVVLVVGVNGSGKTTTCAKLAHLHRSEGRRVLLAAADTFRAAATEQLCKWAERLGVEIVRGGENADPAAVAFDAAAAAAARGVDVLLVDTAGRLHTRENLMRELEKVRRVLARQIPGAPHEVLLVLDATTGQNAVSQARLFTQGVGVTGLVLAKLDGTAKGGVVLAIWEEVSVPVKYVGLGEGADDIAPFDPEAFVDAIFA